MGGSEEAGGRVPTPGESIGPNCSGEASIGSDTSERMKFGCKTDEERFRTQRNERRPWWDFWHSVNQIGKKPKP